MSTLTRRDYRQPFAGIFGWLEGAPDADPAYGRTSMRVVESPSASTDRTTLTARCNGRCKRQRPAMPC